LQFIYYKFIENIFTSCVVIHIIDA